MSNIDKDYELKVLKMVVNKYLDETMSATEENLKALETNCDQVVWELATRIYSQSGNKVELCILRDLVNSWIGDIKYQLAAEKKRIAEQTLYAEFRGDDDRAKVFVKLRKIISETLCVDESQVTLNSHLSKDLGADGLDLVELVIKLEEEFDIEIPDEEIESYLDFSFSSTPSSAFSPSSGSLWGLLESILPCSSQYSSSYYSGDAGANCIVENFLNLICAKISA